MRSYTDSLLTITPKLWTEIGHHNQQDMIRSMIGLNVLMRSLLHRHYDW
jgi:hypothetical protein